MAFTFRLKILTGKHAGREIEVKRSKFVIGRADDCDLRPTSPEISRRHCAFFVEPSGVTLEDLGGSIGTLVNGVPVQNRRTLAGGERIKVGPLEFEAILVATARPQPSTAPAAPSASSTTVVLPSVAPADSAAGQQGTPAKAPAQPDDDDVMQWLTDAPGKPRPRYMKLEPPAEPAATDTGQISLDATQPFGFPDMPQNSDPLPESASRSALRRGKPGPDPPEPKTAGNTQDAAAAALDKFRTTNPTTRRPPA